MSRKLLKKGMPECDFHNDLFGLHQCFGTIEDNPVYWDCLCEELGNISRKYRGNDMEKFVDAALIAFADYMNAKATNQKYTAKMVACIVCANRPKEEAEAIIKEMRAEYE